MLSEMKERYLVDGVVVIECDQQLSAEGTVRITQAAEAAWPGRKVMVLCGGLRVAGSPDRLEQIEAKLDALLEQTARPTVTLRAEADPVETFIPLGGVLCEAPPARIEPDQPWPRQ